jgi:quinol-cytochrome oxidoreductase complex cytochrome b subunit
MPDKDPKDSKPTSTIEFVISVVATVVLAFVIAIWVPTPDHDPTKKVQLALAYAMLVLLFLFGFFVIAAIASGKIDISSLLTESDGKVSKASMSRFQLLIFTFVIGVSFFLVVLCNCKLPDVPSQVLTLLGISASTYGVSKGIHATTIKDTSTGSGGTPPAS